MVLLDEEKFPEEAVTAALNAFYHAHEADNDTARAMKAKFSDILIGMRPRRCPLPRRQNGALQSFRATAPMWSGRREFVMGERYLDLKEMVEPIPPKVPGTACGRVQRDSRSA